LLAAITVGLAACGSPPEDKGGEYAAPATAVSPSAAEPVPAETPETAALGMPAGAPAAFQPCTPCHSVVAGKNGIGPSLAGVYGDKTAQVPGFAFSPAFRQANLTLDDATLDKWLTSPMKMVPGTMMTFAGEPDATRRAALIAYLKSLE